MAFVANDPEDARKRDQQHAEHQQAAKATRQETLDRAAAAGNAAAAGTQALRQSVVSTHPEVAKNEYASESLHTNFLHCFCVALSRDAATKLTP